MDPGKEQGCTFRVQTSNLTASFQVPQFTLRSQLRMSTDSETDHDVPFMEHPTGEFPSAVKAMTSAIERLLKIPSGDKWICFCAQGAGDTEDQVHMAEIRMLGRTLDLGEQAFDMDDLLGRAGLRQQGSKGILGGLFGKRERAVKAERGNQGKVTLPEATPSEIARFMDTAFRHAFGIRPPENQGGDYAVGAEWL